MSRLAIPKILRPLALKDYAPEFGEAVIQIWANPPRDLWLKHNPLVQEARSLQKRLLEPEDPDAIKDPEEAKAAAERLVELGREVQAWYSEIWSQGPEATRWTPAEIEELVSGTQDTDPKLWMWLSGRTLELIAQHRYEAKKG